MCHAIKVIDLWVHGSYRQVGNKVVFVCLLFLLCNYNFDREFNSLLAAGRRPKEGHIVLNEEDRKLRPENKTT